MWFASLSRWNQKGIIATHDWSQFYRNQAIATLRKVLNGVGNADRERCGRLSATLYIQRALTAQEVEGLPELPPPSDLAGGGIELLYQRGCDAVSALPCHNPGRKWPSLRRLDLWLPVDCGVCQPCVARQRLDVEEGVA